MAISRVKTSSIPQGFPKSRSLLAGNTAYDPAATWLIQRVAGTGSAGNITFSSIPQTYKHLQIRVTSRDTGTASVAYMRLNSDSGTNYSLHRLTGTGSAVTASGFASQTEVVLTYIATDSSYAANIMGVGLVDIHDYASTTKNKTVRYFCGRDNNSTNGQISLQSSVWLSTSAITSITLIPGGTAFSTTSTFALYGMVG